MRLLILEDEIRIAEILKVALAVIFQEVVHSV
jgi:hypothetical protein